MVFTVAEETEVCCLIGEVSFSLLSGALLSGLFIGLKFLFGLGEIGGDIIIFLTGDLITEAGVIMEAVAGALMIGATMGAVTAGGMITGSTTGCVVSNV